MTPPNPTANLPSLLIRLWKHLSPRRQYQFFLVFGLMLTSALTEVISLGAVLPFLGVLVAPEKVFNHPLAADFIQAFGFTSADQLLLPLTLIFCTAAILAGVFRTLLLWVDTRLASATGTDLSINIYKRTLYQPYKVHVARNSSEVISGVTDKVNKGIDVITHMLMLASSMISLLAITFTLIVINPLVALITGVASGLVDGANAPITPMGLEILMIARSGISSRIPTDLSLMMSISVARVLREIFRNLPS